MQLYTVPGRGVGTGQGTIWYISGIIPCVKGETNWLLTFQDNSTPLYNFTSTLTFFNYQTS